jgi:tetratricopeptide (TPR) repeat protein
VQALLKSARESAHQDAVQKALAKAFAYEKAYQWREARDAYNETLELEPDMAEAREGYTRAGTVIRALLQYERYIEAAEVLANKAEFQAAIRRFNEAMAVKPSYLVNSDRVQQLHALLMAQNKPVDVIFRSDGDTWVSIQNFRAPEKFETKEIKMLPGDYAVIGRRRGYRDVTMLLQVRNGTPPPTVTVTCNVSSDRS